MASTIKTLRNMQMQFVMTLEHREILEQGLRVMDSTAASLCMDNNIPLVVFNLAESGNIKRLLNGEQVGTLIQTARAAKSK